MSERDRRLERHQSLYQERDKQVTRWMIVTVLFAIVVPWKVLAPYAEKTAMLADVNATLVDVEADLENTAAELKALEAVATRLKDVQTISGEEPWEQSVTDLRSALRHVNVSGRMVAVAGPEQLRATLEQDMHVQGRLMDANAMVRQSAGPPPEMMRPESLEGSPMGGFEALAAEPEDLTDAATQLGFAPADADEIPTGEDEFRTYLETRAQKVGQTLADQTIQSMFDRVESSILDPLGRLLTEQFAAETYLPTLTTQVDELRKRMEEWRAKYMGDAEWYMTVSSKFSRSDELSRELQRWNEEADRVLREHRAAIDENRDELAMELNQLRATKEANEHERVELRERLEKFLPDWLRGLVSPEEMFALHAPLLLALAIFVGTKALLVRRHFMFIRDRVYPDGLSRVDPSLSTGWTLVYRGNGGTAFTAILYLGALGLAWWALEWGTGLAEGWSRLSTEGGGISSEWLRSFQWTGRVLFAVGLVCVPVCLVRDYLSGRSQSVERLAQS